MNVSNHPCRRNLPKTFTVLWDMRRSWALWSTRMTPRRGTSVAAVEEEGTAGKTVPSNGELVGVVVGLSNARCPGRSAWMNHEPRTAGSCPAFSAAARTCGMRQ